MAIEYLPFTQDELPCRKYFEIDDAIYGIEISYNDVGDFYTMYIYDADDNLLFTTKLSYLTNAIDAVCGNLTISSEIVPLNELDAAEEYPGIERIGIDNFDSVKVCLL